MIYTKDIGKIEKIIKDKNLSFISTKYYVRFILEDLIIKFLFYFLIIILLFYLLNLYKYIRSFIISLIVMILFCLFISYYINRSYLKIFSIIRVQCEPVIALSLLYRYLNRKNIYRSTYYLLLIDCLFELEDYESIGNILSELKVNNAKVNIVLISKKIRFGLMVNNEKLIKDSYTEYCGLISKNKDLNYEIIPLMYNFAFGIHNLEYEYDTLLSNSDFYRRYYTMYLLAIQYEEVNNLDKAIELYEEIIKNKHSLLCQIWSEQRMGKIDYAKAK